MLERCKTELAFFSFGNRRVAERGVQSVGSSWSIASRLHFPSPGSFFLPSGTAPRPSARSIDAFRSKDRSTSCFIRSGMAGTKMSYSPANSKITALHTVLHGFLRAMFREQPVDSVAMSNQLLRINFSLCLNSAVSRGR